MARILLVDDHKKDRDWIRARLRSAGFEVTAVGDAISALEQLDQHDFDVLIAEWLVSDISGIELAQCIRRHNNGRSTRAIIASARNDSVTIAYALDNGIDDFLVKPYREGELVARVNGVLRRPANLSQNSCIEIGPIRIDRSAHKITVGQRPLDLAPVEFRLMAYFMENPGRVLARRQLLEQVWRRRAIGERTVDVHVRRLRAALEPHACDDMLQTVRGFGYRFG